MVSQLAIFGQKLRTGLRLRRHVAVESHREPILPLVAPDDDWGNLAVLFSAGTLAVGSEKTEMGSALSAPLVSTLLFAASHFDIIASDASAFPIVLELLLSVAYPLLLFRADLRHVIKPTGTPLRLFVRFRSLRAIVASPIRAPLYTTCIVTCWNNNWIDNGFFTCT